MNVHLPAINKNMENMSSQFQTTTNVPSSKIGEVGQSGLLFWNPPASQPQTAEKSASQPATDSQNPSASQPVSTKIRQPASHRQPKNPPASQPQTAEIR